MLPDKIGNLLLQFAIFRRSASKPAMRHGFEDMQADFVSSPNLLSPDQCFLRVNSRIASSSPSSVRGYIDPLTN